MNSAATQVKRMLAIALDIMASRRSQGTVFRAIRRLRKKCAHPMVIWDVGAHNGAWAQKAKRAAGRNSRVISFEANEKHRLPLRNRGLEHYIVALGQFSGEAVQFFSTEEGGTGDSVYRENTWHYDGVQPETLVTSTLHELHLRFDIPLPDFLKIDTQGSELPILKGLLPSLCMVRWIYLELPITRYNHGAPTLPETVNWLEDHGFVPREIGEIHKADDVVVQMDVLFSKQASK